MNSVTDLKTKTNAKLMARMDAALPGGLGSTYAGHPIAVAGAPAVLDVIEEERLCARAGAGRKEPRSLLGAAGAFRLHRRGTRAGRHERGRILPRR